MLNAARVRLNDAIQSIGGDILKDSQPFTQQMANSAWLRMQQFLANLGYARLIDEEIITGLPIVASSDPASQCWIDWTGFYDGTQIWTGFALPRKCMFPLRIWDRVTGFNAGWGEPLRNIMDGLPATYKYPRNGIFEWRNDRIYMPGSTISVDLRIRFAQFFPFFENQGTVTGPVTAYSINGNVITVVANNTLASGGGQSVTLDGFGTSTFLNGQILTTISVTPLMFTAAYTHANAAATEAGTWTSLMMWSQQLVPIVGSLDALADYICVEACDGRDDVDSQTFKARAEAEAKLIFNRDVRLKNRSNVRRQPRSRRYGSSVNGTYGYGW